MSNFSSAISLKKENPVNLDKGLSKVSVGLGWDVAQPSKVGGFFSRLIGSDMSNSIDLDASLIVLDRHLNVLETIYFANKKSSNGSIVHSGDNLTGEGDGDDEVIHINLHKLQDEAKYIFVTVNSFRGQTFKEVQNATFNFYDNSHQTPKHLYNYSLSDKGENHTAVIMVKIVKSEMGSWIMTAIGEYCMGKTVNQLVDKVKKLIKN